MKPVTRLRALLSLFFCLSPLSAWAGSLEQLHQFLQETHTLRAQFSQTVLSQSGRRPQQFFGTLAISRPGKLRWEILKPYPQLMVGDGQRFWLYDPELKQVSVRRAGAALSGTPAELLAGRNTLDKNFQLRDAGESEGLLWVEARPKQAESGFERIRLGLSAGELQAMELWDAFGQVTQLRFTHLEKNPVLPASLFKLVPPEGTDVVGE